MKDTTLVEDLEEIVQCGKERNAWLISQNQPTESIAIYEALLEGFKKIS